MKSQSKPIKTKVVLILICFLFGFYLNAEQTFLLLNSQKQTDLLSVQDKTLNLLLKNTDYLQASETGKIVYRSSPKSPWKCGEISLKNGKLELVLMEIPAELNNQDMFPTFSPDGSKLLWARYGEVKSTLYVWDFSKKSMVLTKEIAGYVFLPGWSPDAKKLAFYLKEKSPVLSKDDYGFAIYDWAGDKFEQFPVSLRTRLSPQRDRRPKWSNNSKYVSYEGKYENSKKDQSQILVDTATGKYTPCRTGIWINDTDMIFSPPGDESMNLYLNRLNDVLNHKINLKEAAGKVNTPFFEAFAYDSKNNTLFFQSGNWNISAYRLNEKKEEVISKVGFGIQEMTILHMKE